MTPLNGIDISGEEVELAYSGWGCNCGPASIAAVTGLPLDEVRPHMGDFEGKRYTSPTMMWRSLRSLGLEFSYRGGDLGREWWPTYGLARIQWEGPWTRPGVPARAAYRHTHWVGVNARNRTNIGIFDVNAVANGSGWCALHDWISYIVPWILKEAVPRSDGGWHITHTAEVWRD